MSARSDAHAAFKRTELQRSPSPARSGGSLSVLFGAPQRRFESRLREGKIEVRSP